MLHFLFLMLQKDLVGFLVYFLQEGHKEITFINHLILVIWFISTWCQHSCVSQNSPRLRALQSTWQIPDWPQLATRCSKREEG